MPKRPPWGKREPGGEGKGRDYAHWPGQVFHVWPRTLRGSETSKLYIDFQVVIKLLFFFFANGGLCDNLLA